MLALIFFILAIISWFLGAVNFSWNSGNPPKNHTFNWLCLGLMFAGLGLWIAALIH